MNTFLFNSLCYTVGWFWCVLCGIHGHSILATVGALILIFLQLYFVKRTNLNLYIQDLLLALFSVPLGILLEIVFIQTGLIRYITTDLFFPPIWIILLYPLFSLLLNHSLKILQSKYLLAFIVGFLAAPPSYIAGSSLGALTLPHTLILTWILLGAGWGAFLCLLIKIAKILEKATAETFKDRGSRGPVELLYDGECPLCKREICFLKKNNVQANVKFINIAAEDFSSTEHNNIDYETAMKQIHAIDDQGHLIVGLPAFALIYARCNLLVSSTLLRIPFLRPILDPLYKLFAKNRLRMTGR